MTDEVQNLYDMIGGERGPLNPLLSQIPGFRGYMEKESPPDPDQVPADTHNGTLQHTPPQLAPAPDDLHPGN